VEAALSTSKVVTGLWVATGQSQHTPTLHSTTLPVPAASFVKAVLEPVQPFFYLQPTTADTTNWHVADWPTYSWHHFCTVSDVAATSSTLYVDGQVAYSGTPISSHNKFTILGWHGEWAAHNMDGYISEVAWTQAALSAEEIANVYNRGAA